MTPHGEPVPRRASATARVDRLRGQDIAMRSGAGAQGESEQREATRTLRGSPHQRRLAGWKQGEVFAEVIVAVGEPPR